MKAKAAKPWKSVGRQHFMKTEKLNALLKELQKRRCTINPRNDCATITQEYIDCLYLVIEELIEQTVEVDHKGLHFVEVLIRTPELHLAPLPYNLLERRSYYDTAEQKNRAAEKALTNINAQIKILELVLSTPTKTELDNPHSIG